MSTSQEQRPDPEAALEGLKNFQRRTVEYAYRRLFTDLASLGYCNAYAGVTQPNEASMALHRGVGFEYIGTFRSVGRKFDRWHDVAWFQRKLRETPLGVP